MSARPPKRIRRPHGLALCGALLLLAACGGPTPPPAPDVIIPDTTKIPDRVTRDALTDYDPATGVLRFRTSTPLLDELEADDVLVSEPAAAAPYGLLRKVTSVRREGGAVIVETTQAKLTDAVHQGTLDVEGKLEASQLRRVTPLSEGARGRALDPLTEGRRDWPAGLPPDPQSGPQSDLSPQPWTADPAADLTPQVTVGEGFNFEAAIDTVLEIEGETDGVYGKATVAFHGKVRFNVGYRLLIDIGFLADLDAIEASMGFDEETTLSLDADGEGRLKKEYRVARYDFDPIVFFIGPVPVVLVPGAEVVVGVDGEATVHFDYTFSQAGGFVQGVRWDEDDGWQRINRNGFDVRHEGPNFEGTMDLRGYGRSSLRLLIYGVVGPEVGLTAGVRLDVAVPRDPFWILSGYIKGEVAFVIDLLGETERFAEVLFDLERQIVSGAAEPPSITILNANPTIDLGFRTDLAQFFRITDPVGFNYSLRSDVDGSISSVHTFTSAGVRTITITANGASGKTAQAFFTANVTNTPPDPPALEDEANLAVGQGDEFDLNLRGLPQDKNSGALACAAVRWSVAGSDTLVTETGSSTGCNATVIFAEQGDRGVTITVTDPQGLTSERSYTLQVGAPPAVKSPSVKFITVVDAGGSPFPPGTSVGVDPSRGRLPLLTASVDVVNPGNVPLRYYWYIVNKDVNGSYASVPLSESTSLAVNVGALTGFYDPETFTGWQAPICFDQPHLASDGAAFRLEVYVEGRPQPRVKTFDFRCHPYEPPVR